ncbi:Transcription factor [Abeliophyllum distichum]|uniref:Transcription factor n=1 Tax=Abeliophyllum distichum TaxID=126358 RepID=A0ABD1QJD8_9LAMI
MFYLQDSFLMEDLLGQSSGTEQVPVFDTFGPLYSQSTSTTLLKSGDESGKLSCLQPNDDEYFGSGFKTEFTDSLERKFTEEQSLKDDGEKLELHESNLLRHQCPTANLRKSGCMVTEPGI